MVMNLQNNIITATHSSSHGRRPPASREKGWSLNRNRKIIMNSNYDQSDISCCMETRKDKEDNDIHECGKTNQSHRPPVRDQAIKKPIDKDTKGLKTSDDLNGNVLFQEAQEKTCCSGFRSPNYHNNSSSISRSVSFAYSNKNSRDLWERQESCLSLSSAGKDHMPSDLLRPHSSLSNPSRNTLAPGDGGRYSEGNVPIIIQSRKGLRESSEIFSSTERIKRRSAEISQLRLALEEKVKAHRYRSHYLNSTYRNSWSDLPRSSQFLSPQNRPKSACGFRHFEDYFENEHEPLSPLEHRNNNRNIYRWPSLREPGGRSSPNGLSTERLRLHYLGGDQLSSPYNTKKDSGPYLCHRCSSPVRIRPQESYWSLGKEDEDVPSRYHTPTGSPAHRPPQLRSCQVNSKAMTSESKSLSIYDSIGVTI